MSAIFWPSVLLVLLSVLNLSEESRSLIQVDSDGGYKNIVIKIDKNVPEDQCSQILDNLKVRQLRDNFIILPTNRIKATENCVNQSKMEGKF